MGGAEAKTATKTHVNNQGVQRHSDCSIWGLDRPLFLQRSTPGSTVRHLWLPVDIFANTHRHIMRQKLPKMSALKKTFFHRKLKLQELLKISALKNTIFFPETQISKAVLRNKKPHIFYTTSKQPIVEKGQQDILWICWFEFHQNFLETPKCSASHV